MATATFLAGRRILVVEDDFFIADDLTTLLEAAGAKVVGPAASLTTAQDLLKDAEGLDGALLDINLRGEMVFPLADTLVERSIPFVFATGYDRGAIPERFAAIRSCEKPFDAEQIARAMWG